MLAQGGPGMVTLAWAVVQSICLSLWERGSFIIQWLSLANGEGDHTCAHVPMRVYTLVSTTVIHMHTHVHMVSYQVFSSSLNTALSLYLPPPHSLSF